MDSILDTLVLYAITTGAIILLSRRFYRNLMVMNTSIGLLTGSVQLHIGVAPSVVDIAHILPFSA